MAAPTCARSSSSRPGSSTTSCCRSTTARPASRSTRTTSRTSRPSRARTPTRWPACSRTSCRWRTASSTSSPRSRSKPHAPCSRNRGAKEDSLRRSSHRMQLFGLLLVAGLLAVAAAPLGAQTYGIDAATNSNFGKNKVQYRDFVWKVYRSPHFNVHYYTAEEESLQKVVSFAESSYDDLSRSFNFQIKDPVPLIYYATHSAFEQNNVILNFIPEGVGAFASPVRFRMVLPIDLPDEELMKLIRHELTHVFQY